MGTLSFKSVGKTAEQVKNEGTATASSLSPIGFKTPLRFGDAAEGIFAMHYRLEDQLHDNLKNLILTNWGDRVIQYDFGANLRELVTEFVSKDDFDGEAIRRIAAAIGKWMPFVQPETFESSVDHENNQETGVVKIRISYNIPLLNVTGKMLEVTLFVVG